MAEEDREAFTFDIEDVEKMEQLAISASNRILSSIETAVASWEAAGERPAELKPRILRLKHIHQSLSIWEKDTLLSLAKSGFDKKMQQLRRFREIFIRHR